MVGSNVERNRNVKVKKKSPSKESITLIKSQVKTMVKKVQLIKNIYQNTYQDFWRQDGRVR